MVEEPGAGQDAAGKAHEANDGVEISASDSQDHAEGAAQEHEAAHHDAEAQHEAGERGGAAAGLPLALADGNEEAAQHEAHDLGPDVLYGLGAVKAQATHRVADEAGYAEAHVGRVPEEHQHGRNDTDNRAGGNDGDPLLLEVHTSPFLRPTEKHTSAPPLSTELQNCH